MIVYIVRLAGNLVFVTTQSFAVSKYLDSIINDTWKCSNTSIDFWRGEKMLMTRSPAEFHRYASNMKEMQASINHMKGRYHYSPANKNDKSPRKK